MRNYSKRMHILMLIIMLPGFLMIGAPQEEHKKLVEEVTVNWWQVPVFAMDSSGNPVTDLLPKDIEIIVNDGIMPRFTLEKKTFQVTQLREDNLEFDPNIPQAGQFIDKEKKVIFLLFDLTMSSDSAIIRSKEIAEKIIMEADLGTHIFILTIEPYKGLAYIAEGKDNRDELAIITHQKVKRLNNIRIPSSRGIIAPTGTGKRSRAKFSGSEKSLYNEAVFAAYKEKFKKLVYSFETLHICMNAIEGKKFVYFFSEGVSNAGMGGIRGGGSFYRYYLKKIADYLGRSGAILFIINTMGVLDHFNSATSGEESLHFLAQQSGGKYIEGEKVEIVHSLDNIHRAYYEIAFPDIPIPKDIPRTITINSKRKGVVIHTPNHLEKSKTYDEMTDLEKELTAINAITGNPLFKSDFSVIEAQIIDTKQSRKEKIYTVKLPVRWVQNPLDLYKVEIWTDSSNPAASQVKKIDKQSVLSTNDRIEIQFKTKTIQKTNENESIEINHYFVLVNSRINQLYVYRIQQ